MTVTRRAGLVESTKLMEAALDGVLALTFFHSERLTPGQAAQWWPLPQPGFQHFVAGQAGIIL